MKCFRCGHDSKYKERPLKVCPSCKRTFAFEPQDKDPFTDVAFGNAITRVSGGGKLRSGAEHLYYELCRMKRPTSRKWKPGCVAVLLLLTLILIFTRAPFPVWFVLLGLVALPMRFVFFPRKTARLTTQQFNDLLTRWSDAHGSPAGLIVRPKSVPATPRAKEPDLHDYSFDRAVICDRARTVDLLLANNFHFENNCAVLGINGYPEGPFETVRAMLMKNPKLHVFALHDATPGGCQLAHRLSNDPNWFRGRAVVTDVGIRPRHAGPFVGLFMEAAGSTVPVGHGIDAGEAAWLSRYGLELAAIRPEQVLKRLYRALNRRKDDRKATRPDNSDYFEVDIDITSFGSDADASDGGADGFG